MVPRYIESLWLSENIEMGELGKESNNQQNDLLADTVPVERKNN